MVGDATAKLVHIILQSRVVFSSGLFPTKDCDSFNLEIKLEHDVRTKISSWRQSVGALQNPAVPMAVDIYHTAPPTPLAPHPKRTLLEHWTLLYEPHLGGNRRAMDKKRSLLQTAVMVRAVYSFLYVVPTADIVTQTRRHRGYGKLDFSFSSNPAAHPFDTDDIESFSFGGIETEFGTLLVDVIYRRDCSDLVDSSFLNSSVHYSSAPMVAAGRPRTASGLGLGHLMIDDDYQQPGEQTATKEEEEAPLTKTTRPRTFSLPQKPLLPGQAGSYPQTKSSSMDRTMPNRPSQKRKSVAESRTWAALERQGLSHDDQPLGDTEVLYSRPPNRQHSSPTVPPGQLEGVGVQGHGGKVHEGSKPTPVHLRRAETTPSVYQHPQPPVVPYMDALPDDDRVAGKERQEQAEKKTSALEEAPFPAGFFVDAAGALESSRVVQRSLVDGRKGERRHVDWADLRSDVSWGTAPGKGSGASPSVSPFKDAPMSAQSALLRSRNVPKPSTEIAPLWASCVAPSEKRTAPKPRPPVCPFPSLFS